MIITTLVTGFITIDISKTNSQKLKSPGMQLIEGDLASLEKADAWLNSQPLTPAELKGKVVLIQFCTYTCINWLRTLPYIRAWKEKYKDKGLVVIGVHTPEFSFEKNIDNVRRSIKDRKIDCPVAIDNNYAIWEGFDNHYWPALYFIDAKGNTRYKKFGEGEYEQSEKIIQQLLTEAGVKNIDHDLAQINANGVEAAADWGNLKSPETYLGYERTENFANNDPVFGKQHVYSKPLYLGLNQWAVSGNWTLGKQFIVLNNQGGRIVYRFHSRDVHLVMGPALAGKQIRFRVLIDGQPPEDAHGTDTDESGNGTVKKQRLYQLIRQPNSISDRKFEIEFLDPGAEVFAFTFG